MTRGRPSAGWPTRSLAATLVAASLVAATNPAPARAEATPGAPAVAALDAEEVATSSTAPSSQGDALPSVEEVVIESGPPPPPPIAPVLAVEGDDARLVPGTQGDPVKVLEALPGVARPELGASSFSLWGAAPDETRLFVDGVEVPALFHVGGLRALVAPEQVARVTITPAGQDERYGRGLGGVVEVDTRGLGFAGARGVLAVDPLDVAAYGEAAASDVVAGAAAARQGLVSALVPALTGRDFGETLPLPAYRDGLLRLDVDLGGDERLDLLVLGAQDALERVRDSRDPAERQSEEVVQDFLLARGRWASRSSSLVPSVLWARRERALRQGEVEARQTADELRLGLRALHRERLAPGWTMSLGLDAVAQLTWLRRAGSLTVPPREGDPALFGRAPSDAVGTDRWSTIVLDLAPHVGLDVELGPLALHGGLRVDVYGLETSRLTPKLGLTPAIGGVAFEPRASPRVGAHLALVPGLLAARAAAGLYDQPPDPEAASAVFGNPRLGVSRGGHATAAVELSAAGYGSLELAGFARWANGLAARSTAEAPRLAEVLTDEGEGRALGAQALLRFAVDDDERRLFGWVGYTFVTTERRDAPSAAWRRADFERPHGVSAVAGYHLGSWRFGARFRFSSGAPRTDVVGRFYDARRDRYEPVLGPVNAASLPDFFQLDARVEHALALGSSSSLVLGVEVLNATARANVEALAWRADYGEADRVTGLPLLVLLGARLEL